ncbi:MAG: hypothetical protein Q8P92_03315 [Candidatus Daviesbacteria bacterium]|nr:hypothetical protein [Candidatus Daviesbacteria bacterium]
MVEKARRILIVEENPDISDILSGKLTPPPGNIDLRMVPENAQVLEVLMGPESDFHMTCLSHSPSTSVEELISLAEQIKRLFPHTAVTIRSNADQATAASILNSGVIDDVYSKQESASDSSTQILALRVRRLLERLFRDEQ